MTSSVYTVGLDGNRNSSKVLKPPGGDSSDIFGLGAARNGTSNGIKNTKDQESTTNRLFGAQVQPDVATPSKACNKADIEKEGQALTKSVKKPYVRRNPITGEEVTIYVEYETKAKDKNENESNDQEKSSEEVEDEQKKTEVPAKPIQTSIRVRNPPGGKSSGIF